MTNKFTVHLGNDAVIRVKFYVDEDGTIVTSEEGDLVANLEALQNVVVELVNRFGKRVVLPQRVEEDTLVIELNVDKQKLGNHYLDIRFDIPNPAFSDKLQAYRFRLDGVEIIEASEESGGVLAALDKGELETSPSKAELYARIEELEKESLNSKEMLKDIEGLLNYHECRGDVSNSIVRHIAAHQFSAYRGRKINEGTGRYTFDSAKSVGSYAFIDNQIDYISLPSATSIDEYAFAVIESDSLEIRIPSVRELKEKAFYEIPSGTKVYVSEYLFDSISALSDEYLDSIFSFRQDGDVVLDIYSSDTNRNRRLSRHIEPRYA